MARYPSEWIFLTNPHITDTYAIPEGIEFLIAPNDNLKTGDIIYLWANPFNLFYAWGEIALTPRPEVVEAPGPQGLEKIKRYAVAVRNIKHLHPQITEEMMRGRPELRKLIPKGYDDLYAIPLRPGQAAQLNDFIREFKLDAPHGSATVSWIAREDAPQIDLNAELVIQGDKSSEGRLVEGVRIAWYEIIRYFGEHPEELFNIDPRRFEELIAGAYEREGYRVELTDRSGDRGRDVVATMPGIGSIRIFDQVKRYKISRSVTADDVRALIGTITMAGNVSKGVLTTTSHFAPNLLDDPDITRLIPYRIELKPREVLLPWLRVVAKNK